MRKAQLSKVIASTALIALAVLFGPGAAQGQTVSYTLGATADLLDPDFYSGEASDGSDVDGRGVLNVAINNAGTKALFWAINMDTLQRGLFMVDVGYPDTWRRVSPDQGGSFTTIVWCPDDRHAYVALNTKFDTLTETLFTNHRVNLASYLASHATALPSNNWMTSARAAGFGQLYVNGIQADGEGDNSRPLIYCTNFPVAPTESIQFPIISADGDSAVFAVSDLTAVPTTSQVYRLTGLNAILVASRDPVTLVSAAAPISLADPRITQIRPSMNYVGNPAFSPDGSLVFTTEDYNGVWNFTDFFNSLPLTDFDLNLNNADGSGYLRFAQPDGQGTIIPFRSGVRFHYISNLQSVITTLSTENDIDTETDPIPGEGTNDTIVDGNPVTVPFTLSNSVVATTTPVQVTDASGTVVDLPDDQIINFPQGSGATEISIVTPIDPVTPIELPDPQTSIPVLRDFGPEGTQFYPPITISITYTDAEVAEIADEASMIPYLYNAGSSMFEPLDPAFLPTVSVDTVNNILSFQTDHFSIYGVGGVGTGTAMPQRPWTLVVLTLVIGLVALTGFVGLYRSETNSRRK